MNRIFLLMFFTIGSNEVELNNLLVKRSQSFVQSLNIS